VCDPIGTAYLALPEWGVIAGRSYALFLSFTKNQRRLQMENIFIRNVKNEVVAFIDRKASELSTTSKRKVTRNEYINLILEKQLRDDLSLDDRLDDINTTMNKLVDAINEEKKSTDQLIGLMFYGEDANEEE